MNQDSLKMTVTRGVALVAILLASTVHAQSEPLTIVAFGDSTTEVRSTIKQVYADRLPALLKAQGIEAKVINAGIGGSHTGRQSDNPRFKINHALDRFDTAVRAHNPDIVIIQFGWNDSWIDSNKEGGTSRISAKAYRENLIHIVTTLKKDGAKIILMTPNRPRSTIESWRLTRTEEYVNIVRKLSDKHKCPLIDIWEIYTQLGSNADELLLDLLHPGDGGHRIVAEKLTQKITTIMHNTKGATP